MGLNMCLLAPRHPPLVSRFSRMSSTWGFVTFGIRATHHVEYGLERNMGCGSVVGEKWNRILFVVEYRI
jgi:hypothetical protein